MSNEAVSQAVQAGDLALFQSYIHAVPDAERSTAYQTAAKEAIRADKVDILTECLRVGGVSAAGYGDGDLSFEAAEHGSPAAIAALCDHGRLDVREPPNEHAGSNFLNWCVSDGNLPALKYLMEQRGCGFKDFGPIYGNMGTGGPFPDAVAYDHPEILRYFLDRDDATKQLNGLLHLAAQNGRTEIMQLLLDRKVAEIDDIAKASRSQDPGTPLQSAATGRNLTGLRFLLDVGADVTKKDPRGRDIFERSKYNNPEKTEWPDLVTELRQRGLLSKFGRE